MNYAVSFISAIFIFSVYLIFIKGKNNNSCIDKRNDVFEITDKNYANILKAANENIDSYIGLKVHVKGYVYRLINFDENQFVIARNMLISNNSQSLVVGFLCEYEKAKDFDDGTWVDIVGEIKKGDFSGDIAILKVLSITPTEKLENSFVSMPDDTYIPTLNMF